MGKQYKVVIWDNSDLRDMGICYRDTLEADNLENAKKEALTYGVEDSGCVEIEMDGEVVSHYECGEWEDYHLDMDGEKEY